ncbi:PREDICTED: undifferentiated embryonic cell transcription factor 1 [Chrysochloris asiatica]|uniref:Undifferentiated embryonic cell transcription factor 1 n=1 Tax=Chrysochloris asiatica TaxID=185453 RepID=A0A9B0TNU9_CHRAS|nr:PREDICTED: undifferentiated embryonic cell transcription factor 1 [Chrysochloris asiatica]
MLLRPRRPLPPVPLATPEPSSPVSPNSELWAAGDTPATPPGALAAPVLPVSPGSAQRTPWSARETELLLATLLEPTVWRSLLLDRRQALPTYRRVSAALARLQVRRTPAQCRRRYKFLKDKVRDAEGQPPGPFDAQIRELMALLGDQGQKRGRRRSPGPGRPPRGRRPAPNTLASDETDASPLLADHDPDAEHTWTLRFSPTPPKSAGAPRASDSPPPTLGPAASLASAHAVEGADRLPDPPQQPAPSRPPCTPSPTPSPTEEHPGPQPGRPGERVPPRAASSLNEALLETLGHLGHIAATLGPLREQLLILNQHVEQLRGSFDQTVSLAVGFILGNASAERGLLTGRRE